MIYEGTNLIVSDNTGVLEVKCIKVLGNNKKYAKIGDRVIVIVKRYSLEKGYLRDKKKKHRFLAGRKLLGLVIRTKKPFKRNTGFLFSFEKNCIILINKRGIPLSSRIKGPVNIELTERLPVLGTLTYNVF